MKIYRSSELPKYNSIGGRCVVIVDIPTRFGEHCHARFLIKDDYEELFMSNSIYEKDEIVVCNSLNKIQILVHYRNRMLQLAFIDLLGKPRRT